MNYLPPFNSNIGRPEFGRMASIIAVETKNVITEMAVQVLTTSLDTQLYPPPDTDLHRLIPISTRINGTKIICSLAPPSIVTKQGEVGPDTTCMTPAYFSQGSNALYLQNPLGSSFEVVNGSIDDSIIL